MPAAGEAASGGRGRPRAWRSGGESPPPACFFVVSADSGSARLEVGRVVKPHGLRGEVVVALFTNRTERLDPGTVLGSERGPLEVLRSSAHHQRWIVAFAGVGDHAGAEALRGVVLSAEALDDPDALWVHELVGAEVVDGAGAVLGTVVAVEANPASDLLVLEGGGLVPLRFVVSSEAGRVVVEVPAGLLDG